MNYEEKLKKLGVIVDKLENSEIGIEEGIGLYDEGVALCKECLAELNGHKGKLTVIRRELTKLSEKPFKGTPDNE